MKNTMRKTGMSEISNAPEQVGSLLRQAVADAADATLLEEYEARPAIARADSNTLRQ